MADNSDLINKLVEAGLEEKYALLIIDMASQPPAKASEIGKRLGLSRMDAYNSLKKLQQQGLVKATLDKPIRFFGMTINEVFKQIIRTKEMDLRRINENLDSLNSSSNHAIISRQLEYEEDSFSVLKDRHAIHATIESIVSEAERHVWLLLGKWGILHILRSGCIDAITEALNRDVDVKLVVCIDEKTIRFYDKLDSRMEIRHHADFNLCGVFVDNEVGIQFVQTEELPTGRGKEDTAILMESEMLLTAQSELLKTQWNSATSYSTAKAKMVDGLMTEPLKLTLGEGSFYEKFKQSMKMGIDSNSNAVLTRGGDIVDNQEIPQSNTLTALGINTNQLFEDVGFRIGQELAVKLQHITDDEIFWNNIKSEWRDLGMGEIDFDNLPPSKITVLEGNACGGQPEKSLFFCNMDESVIAGLIKERYDKSIQSCKRECVDDHKSCCYEISIVD
ncbi:MAG: helix-turn-helix domain-containing protein [Candidatus Poseidoniaceae archaeon]